MSEDVRHLWVLSMSDGAVIHRAMTEVTGVTVKSSEQHVEMGVARALQRLYRLSEVSGMVAAKESFFIKTNTYTPSIGLVSTDCDDVNCDEAEEVGLVIQEKFRRYANAELQDQTKISSAVSDYIAE